MHSQAMYVLSAIGREGKRMRITGAAMPGEDKPIDPLPGEFRSPEEAAEFWDTHNVTDYEEFLEPVEIDV
ncbi:MAG: BrnA antitoxin family protein, partial [Planctomycetes bacterium]|nr:BrnA antitoxin family protein [Planctomycetota bacterium]